MESSSQHLSAEQYLDNYVFNMKQWWTAFVRNRRPKQLALDSENVVLPLALDKIEPAIRKFYWAFLKDGENIEEDSKWPVQCPYNPSAFVRYRFYNEGFSFWDSIFLYCGVWTEDSLDRVNMFIEEHLKKDMLGQNTVTLWKSSMATALCSELGLTAENARYHVSRLPRMRDSRGKLFTTIPWWFRQEMFIKNSCTKQEPCDVSFSSALRHRAYSIRGLHQFNDDVVGIVLGFLGWRDLSHEQACAVLRASCKRFSAVVGCGGTGKTSCVAQTVFECASDTIGVNAVLAPSHCSLKILVDALQHSGEAMTVQKLERGTINDHMLDAIPFGDGGLLVVDEASMIDLSCLYAVFRVACHFQCPVLFMGDVQQLPPINRGRGFYDLVTNGYIPSTALTRVFRIDSADVLDVVGRVREGAAILDENVGGNVCYQTSTEAIRELTDERHGSLGEDGRFVDEDFVFLARTNEDVFKLNHWLFNGHDSAFTVGGAVVAFQASQGANGKGKIRRGCSYVRSDGDRHVIRYNNREYANCLEVQPREGNNVEIKICHELVHGQRILFNKQSCVYQNGDDGILLGIAGQKALVQLRRMPPRCMLWQHTGNGVCHFEEARGFLKTHPDESLPQVSIPLEHCIPYHSRTVHKAQGQSWQNVTIYMSRSGKQTTEFLYTAVSRAKRKLDIVDPGWCFKRRHVCEERLTVMSLTPLA